MWLILLLAVLLVLCLVSLLRPIKPKEVRCYWCDGRSYSKWGEICVTCGGSGRVWTFR